MKMCYGMGLWKLNIDSRAVQVEDRSLSCSSDLGSLHLSMIIPLELGTIPES